MFALLFSAAAAFAAPSPEFLADLELFKARSVALPAARERTSADRLTTVSRLLQLTPSVSVAVGREETKVRSDVSRFDANSPDTYWRLSSSWNLFRGFGDYQAWKGARAEESSQKFQVRSQELQTELDGAKAVFNWLWLHDVAGAQAELLRLKQETMRIGRDRYRQGKIPLQEVTKMEVDLAQQQNVVRQSEIDIAGAEATYRSFFVDSLRTKGWPLAEGQAVTFDEGEGSFATKALRQRALSLEGSWKSARAAYWPSLDLSISYKRMPLERDLQTGTWYGALELSLPLWSRFETSAASAQSFASYAAADAEAATAERNEELRRAYLRKKISLSQANLRDARLYLEKADGLYRDMLRSFQLGRLSTNDLFQEQDRKVRALLSYSGSRQAFHESVMEACALWGLEAARCLR